MPSRRVLVTHGLVALALLATGAVGLGAAVAPPQAACLVCTDALDDAAADRGVAVERGATSQTVRVGADATTTWTARVELETGATPLANDSLRDAVVDDALDDLRTAAEPRNVTTRLAGETLVVSYEDPDAAVAVGDEVVLVAFHASSGPPWAIGGEGSPYVGADVLRVVGPADHVASAGGDARVDGRTARWNATAGDELKRSTTVGFAAESRHFATCRATAARYRWRLAN
ncbi:hypothetical protein [Haloparvum alkalitolerans]|uniref:hypothetical protein n=1 Tax=Haloparvum alkalitolerans TaxID=1042953 RepID=UPI003CFABE4A